MALEYLGPKTTTTNRVATYSELGGASSNPYVSNSISADLTIPTGNSMIVANEYFITGTVALIVQGTSIFKID